MRTQTEISLTGNRILKVKYACEEVSPESYYDYMHNHSFYEICIFLSGSMLHFAGGKPYRLSRGDVFFCRPGEFHYAIAAEDSVYERYALWVPTDIFSFMPQGSYETLDLFSDARLHGGNVIHLDLSREAELLRLLDLLKNEISRHDISSLAVFCRVSELLLFISDAADLPDDTAALYAKDEHLPAMIHNVIRYVRDNYATVKGIDEIADHFYMNKDYLTRVFKQHTGLTIHDYIRSVRICKSRRMLSDGCGVTETAFACGFNSTSYFIRVFTKATGVTPAEFKRSTRQN